MGGELVRRLEHAPHHADERRHFGRDQLVRVGVKVRVRVS